MKNWLIHGALGALLACALPAGAGINTFTRTGPDGGSVWAIAAQPGQPDVVLAQTGRGVYRSTNAGVTWTLASHEVNANSIVFDSVSSNRVYAIGTRVHVSTDGGATFTLSPGSPNGIYQSAVSRSRIYVVTQQRTFFRSDDGAQTWTQLPMTWTSGINAMAADPNNDGVVYACVIDNGTYKTTDRGANWTGPIAGSPCAGNFDYAWSYDVSPVDSNRILAATGQGVYLSIDGGASWAGVAYPLHGETVKFDPAAPMNAVVIPQIGPLRWSSDGGATWPTTSITTWPNLMHARLYGGTFTGVAGRLYLAAQDGPLHNAVDPAQFVLRAGGMHASTVDDLISADDGTIYALQSQGPPGVWRRAAGSWTPLDNAELRTLANNELRITSIATAAEDSSRVYATLGLLYRSNNRGADWSGPELSGQAPHAVTVDPTNPQVAYASGSGGGTSRTTDGGLSFTPCSAVPSPPFKKMLVDRAAPNTIYAFGWYPPYYRLYKSVDSCQTWTDLTGEFMYPLYDVAIDPADHNKIYAVLLDGVLRSRDGGASWARLRFPDPHGEQLVAHRVLIDPVLPGTLWVLASSTTGFWRSVDDGASWQHVQIPYTGNFIGLYAGVLDPLSPDTLVAGANTYGLVEYQVAPDLQVTLDLPPGPLQIGAAATATMTVRNNGPLDASAAEVTLTIPAFMNAASLPANCTAGAGNVRCRVGALYVNQSVNLALSLTPTAAFPATNVIASVDGHEADSVSSNNSATREVTAVTPADLRLGIAGGGITLDHGATTRYTINASNPGGTPASNTVLLLNLTGFTSPAVTISRGSCVVAAPTTTCTIGTLAPGEVVTATLDVTVGAVGTNTLEARLREQPAGSEFMQLMNVIGRPVGDVSVAVTDSADPVLMSVGYQYTATVRNESGDAAPVDFSATLTGGTVASVTTAGGTCTNTATSVSCALTALAAGASTTVTINTSSAVAGSASLSATLTYAGTDSAAANNTASATTTINSPLPPPTPGPPAGSPGGGGGGRIDWLFVGLLGLLLARRVRPAAARG